MKIIQVLPCMTYGDAVGNDTLALDKLFMDMGYETVIYAQVVGKRIPEDKVRLITQWEEPDKGDVLIYHMAIAFDYLPVITQAQCRKIGIYHNITPSEFYLEYNSKAYMACIRGLNQVKQLNKTFDYCLADSSFNKQDLRNYGYTCKIDVLPILIPYEDYRQKPKRAIIKKHKGHGPNVLFVGRVVPNKKQEDLIAVFSLYQRYYDKNAKLFIVGSFDKTDAYCGRLLNYIDALGLADSVIIPGHISFDEILGYYASADVFVCLSEHEGFCVPLIEAMLFDVPIIAYDKCAVGETLGGSSIVVKEKNFLEIAGLIDRVMKDSALRENIIQSQHERLKFFRTSRVEALAKKYFNQFLKDAE